MEVISFFETSVHIRTTRRYNPGDGIFQINVCIQDPILQHVNVVLVREDYVGK
jgi:hypothetical protein